MNTRKAGWLVIAGALLASCATPRTRPTDTALVLDHHNFDYSIADREGVRLIQAFDDGSKTYLQFTRAPSEPLVIVASSATPPLAYLGTGPYVVVPGVYSHLTVSVGAHSADIDNHAVAGNQISAAPAVANAQAPELQPESAQAEVIKAQVGALQARITELEAELVEAHAAGRAGTVSIGLGGRVIIHFANYSRVVDIDDGVLQALGGSAMAAKRINLHGRTDSFTLSATAAELAVARAVAVKKLLIAQGVQPEHIRIFYRGAGGFATDNSTQPGKAVNRRVEIQMIKG